MRPEARQRAFRALFLAKQREEAEQLATSQAEDNQRIAMTRQIYRYAVCLISLVAIFATAPRTIRAMFEYQDPIQVKQAASDVDVSSWDNFRRELETKMGRREYMVWLSDQNDEHNDNGWAAYVAAREARLNTVSFEARNSLVANGLVAIFAVLLFISHAIAARRAHSPFMD